MEIRLTTKEQEELVINNLRLVNYLVNKLGVAPNEFDDIVSVGKIGLIKAAVTFDSSKGMKFSTYAARCINNEIFMYFRKERKRPEIVSLEDSIYTDKDGKDLTLGETIPSSETDILEEIADKDLVERLINIILNVLKSRERVIMLYKISGINQRSIAEILNISRSYISRIETRLINELRLYLINPQDFNKFFSMVIVDNSYKILFSSRDVMQFNRILAILLKRLTSAEALPDFKIVCNKEQIMVQVPANPESFYFIAQIIQEIDNYSASDKK